MKIFKVQLVFSVNTTCISKEYNLYSQEKYIAYSLYLKGFSALCVKIFACNDKIVYSCVYLCIHYTLCNLFIYR